VFEKMDALAAAVVPGSEGLVAIDFFQGNRNPHKDPKARGAIWGLSLRHNVSHIYRAFYEAIAYGVRCILEDMAEHGYHLTRVLAGGGGAKSGLWMQIHADITGYPIRLAKESESTALGAAIWAGIGAGVFSGYGDASTHMVRLGETIHPDFSVKPTYDFYYKQYVETYVALKPLMHRVASFEESRGKVQK